METWSTARERADTPMTPTATPFPTADTPSLMMPGQNNLTEYDAFKAAALLKNKLKKSGKFAEKALAAQASEKRLSRLESQRRIMTCSSHFARH